MSGFRLRGLCGTSRASAGRLRPIGLAALATCIILLSSFGSALAQTTFTSITPSSSTVAVGTPITLTANVTPPIGPTGTVGFYYEPQNFLGTANLNSPGWPFYQTSYFRSAFTSSMQSTTGIQTMRVAPASRRWSISPGRRLSPKVLVPPQSFRTVFQRSRSRSPIPLQRRRTG